MAPVLKVAYSREVPTLFIGAKHIQTLEVGYDVYRSLWDWLEKSTLMHPPSSRIVKDMKMGFLPRFVRLGSFQFMHLLTVLQFRLSRIV